MKRIDHVTKATDLFGSGKHGFTGGSVSQQIARTVVTPEFMNDVQEELANAVEQAGITLQTNTRDQLNHAICARLETMAIANHSARTAGGGYGGDFEDIVFGGSKFLAVGTAGGIQTSSDGDTWTQQTPDAAYAGTFRAALYASGLFLLAGSAGELQTSPNGTAFTHRNAAGSYSGLFRAVAYGGGLYLAAGDSGEIQTSPNGTTWTHRNAAGGYSGSVRGAAYGAGAFVLVGNSGAQRSTDGITWTGIDTMGSEAVTYGSGLFVRGTTSNGVYTSPDGIVWTSRDPAVGFDAVARVGHLFVGLNSGGGTYVSPDGLSWRNLARSGFTTGLLGAAYGADTFVLVGSSTAIRRSLAL